MCFSGGAAAAAAGVQRAISAAAVAGPRGPRGPRAPGVGALPEHACRPGAETRPRPARASQCLCVPCRAPSRGRRLISVSIRAALSAPIAAAAARHRPSHAQSRVRPADRYVGCSLTVPSNDDGQHVGDGQLRPDRGVARVRPLLRGHGRGVGHRLQLPRRVLRHGQVRRRHRHHRHAQARDGHEVHHPGRHGGYRGHLRPGRGHPHHHQPEGAPGLHPVQGDPPHGSGADGRRGRLGGGLRHRHRRRQRRPLHGAAAQDVHLHDPHPHLRRGAGPVRSHPGHLHVRLQHGGVGRLPSRSEAGALRTADCILTAVPAHPRRVPSLLFSLMTSPGRVQSRGM